MTAKRQLIKYIEDKTGVRLDPDNIVIGFARRFAAYKRSGLIFHNMGIIEPLLRDRAVQVVFAGKAHPLDDVGKQIAGNLMEYVERYPESVVFLENYHMGIAKLLVSGCDVWLNTPQRPLEASGTSGMKAALNGVLNLSILDGWWPEGCVHRENGWQIGGGYEGPEQTRVDAASLYDVLLNEVIPTYYENRKRWVEMMNKAIAMAENRFTMDRTLTEYYNLMYQPATTLKDIKKQVFNVAEIDDAHTQELPQPVHV